MLASKPTSFIVGSVMSLGLALTSAHLSYADSAFDQSFKEAKEAFAKRSAHDPHPVENALQKLAALEGKSEDSDQNYEVLVLESQAYYWKGGHSAKSEALEAYKAGEEKAVEATKINPDYADAYYYAGINLGRWGELNGMMASLSKVGQLKSYMNDAEERLTLAGADGKEIDGYGPSRVFGRLYFKLPTLLGGSRSDSLKRLEGAYTHAKNVALNFVYYAEVLAAGDSDEKQKAKDILTELLSHDPQIYNPDRTPETLEEFELAKELKSKIN